MKKINLLVWSDKSVSTSLCYQQISVKELLFLNKKKHRFKKSFLLFITFINFFLISQSFGQTNPNEAVNIFSFPSAITDACNPESLFSQTISTVSYKKLSLGLMNDMEIKTNQNTKYTYSSKNQLIKINTNIENLKNDSKKAVQDAITNEELKKDLNKSFEELDIKKELVTDISYNGKGQISKVIMSNNIFNSIGDIKPNLGNVVNVTYDDMGRIKLINEVYGGNVISQGENKIVNIITDTKVEYLSDLSFKCTSVTKEPGETITKNSVVTFTFNNQANLIHTTIKQQTPSGRIINNKEIDYEYYEIYKNPSAFNMNLQFILAMRVQDGISGNNLISVNCCKKSITKDLLHSNEQSIMTIDNVIFYQNNCIIKYVTNTNFQNSTGTQTNNFVFNDYYFIRFYAYSAWTKLAPPSDWLCGISKWLCDVVSGKSKTGHIFVGFFKNGVPEDIKGFDGSEFWHVTGLVGLKDQEYLIKYGQMIYTVRIKKEDYDKAKAITKHVYVAGVNDCVSYADDVADMIKLNTPKKLDMTTWPVTYLQYLIDNN